MISNRKSDPSSGASPPKIAPPLRRWFLKNQRDLPWRKSRDPYRVWISEIMLQQTQVSTVIDYYNRFLAKFPEVESLARAPEEVVLELWAGLGYYSRGRNLHRAAQMIVREFQGQFPENPETLRSLPGVGEYTAAAVGSIAFGHEVAAVDGNVERVLSRIVAIPGDLKKGAGRTQVRETAQAALDRSDPGIHNQAMMELGALVCRPKSPRCGECPVQSLCAAYARDEIDRFPQPKARRALEAQHWIAVIVETHGKPLLFPTGSESELLPGHWGVPLERHPGSETPSQQWIRHHARQLAAHKTGLAPAELGHATILEPIRHGITYRKLNVTPVRFNVEREQADLISENRSIRYRSESASLPTLFEKILDQGHDTHE